MKTFLGTIAGLALCHGGLAQSLPIVNLGYELHQASSFNSTGGFYNFSNIRYAEPPVGDLRFRAPVPVQSTSFNGTLNDGSVGHICPQAIPAWTAISAEFVPAYLEGLSFNLTAAEASLANMTMTVPPQDPRTSEDCLFLDVVVPQAIFEKANSSNAVNSTSGAPVLVWIYGGGYTEGDKNADGNPAGLIKESQVSGSDGIVYVALNYRLGAFGWLAGPTLQSDGISNAALYDQRAALQWVQGNIHLFGGDPDKVTVIGESAGGGSIMHQVTAFGGLAGPAPFSQAVLQSPAWAPLPGSLQQEQTFDAFLAILNVSTIAEARQLPSSVLITANIIQVANSTYGTFTYGPVVDGVFAPSLPGRLLLQGNFDKSLKIMVGHNGDEGLDFENPAITSTAALEAELQVNFPDIAPATISYITNVLYPPVFDGTYPYTTQLGRATLVLSESTFSCNTFYLDRAFGNQTYAYQFSVPPALHGQDIPYTFFNGPSPSVLNDTVAIALQEYITSFAESGKPSGPGIPMFPLYGNNSQILDLNISSIPDIMDPNANARCAWWQKALYF